MYTCYNKPFFLWYCLAVGLSEAKNDVNANEKNGTSCHGLGDTLPKSWIIFALTVIERYIFCHFPMLQTRCSLTGLVSCNNFLLLNIIMLFVAPILRSSPHPRSTYSVSSPMPIFKVTVGFPAWEPLRWIAYSMALQPLIPKSGRLGYQNTNKDGERSMYAFVISWRFNTSCRSSTSYLKSVA